MKHIQLFENHVKMENITSISNGKIIIPINIYDRVDANTSKSIRAYARKLKQDTNNNFIYIPVRELNRLYQKNNPSINDVIIFSWNDVVEHMKKYIDYHMDYFDLENNCGKHINRLLDEFFLYMPFITYRMPDIIDLSSGYCCEDCDGEFSMYKKIRFESYFRSFINKFKSFNFKIIDKK